MSKAKYTTAARHRNGERRKVLTLIESHKSMLHRIGTAPYDSLVYKVLDEIVSQIRNNAHRGGPR